MCRLLRTGDLLIAARRDEVVVVVARQAHLEEEADVSSHADDDGASCHLVVRDMLLPVDTTTVKDISSCACC
jgi:hypothetical protein